MAVSLSPGNGMIGENTVPWIHGVYGNLDSSSAEKSLWPCFFDPSRYIATVIRLKTALPCDDRLSPMRLLDNFFDMLLPQLKVFLLNGAVAQCNGHALEVFRLENV